MVQKLLNWSYVIFFVCGLAAGIAALVLSLIFKLSFNGIFVPEIASQALVSLTSGQIESVAVETLGPLAKYSSFFGAIFANILLYGIIGVFLGILYDKIHSKKFITRAILSSFVSYIILLLFTVSFIIINTVPGQKLLISPVPLAILFVPHLVYGFIFSFFFERISKDKSTFPLSSGQKPQTIDDVTKEQCLL